MSQVSFREISWNMNNGSRRRIFHGVNPTACRMLPNGLSAMIGPTQPGTGPLLDSLCSAYHIPFIAVGPQLSFSLEFGEFPKRLNLHPATDVLSKAYFDVVNMTEWKTISVIYDSEEGKRPRDCFDPASITPSINKFRLDIMNFIPFLQFQLSSSSSTHPAGPPSATSCLGNLPAFFEGLQFSGHAIQAHFPSQRQQYRDRRRHSTNPQIVRRGAKSRDDERVLQLCLNFVGKIWLMSLDAEPDPN